MRPIGPRVSFVVHRSSLDRAEKVLTGQTEAAIAAGLPSTARPTRSDVLREALDAGLSVLERRAPGDAPQPSP